MRERRRLPFFGDFLLADWLRGGWAALGWLWLGLLLVGCRSPQPAGDNLTALAPAAFEEVALPNNLPPEWLRQPTDLFRLGPGDVIEIENLAQPQETPSVLLTGPDGKIYYNMLAGISVWGLTLSETKETLEKELGRYTRVKPELAVSLRTVGSKRVWVLGSVHTPGVYPLATPLTVLEAIAMAGGVQTAPGSAGGLPDLGNSFVMRNGSMLHLDFHRLLGEGDLSQNIYLQPDDFIYLKSAGTRDVFVLGAVVAPNVVTYHDRLTVLGAITAVGGTVPYANVTHVAIVRGSLQTPRIAVADYRAIHNGQAPNILLEPGDIVYVPFVPYRKLGVLAEQLLEVFVRTVAANEGNRAIIPGATPIGIAVPGTPPQ